MAHEGRLVLVAAICLFARTAAADERDAEQIEQYSRLLSSLETEDVARKATTELGALRAQLHEAGRLQSNGRQAELTLLLKVIKPQVQLIKALIELGVAEQGAAEQRAQADQLEEKASRMKREADLLRQRLNLLEEQARARAGSVTPAAAKTIPAS
ncbi:MAG: hypothetical protein FJ125_01340, partial [Deltaproteobacteria bacterium]|nr:hypothetical protein [Deltaproteobacteria bacterium]